jgi:hypothetical protein
MISLKRYLFVSVVIALAAAIGGQTSNGQQRLQVPQASQKASVMQRLGLTDISVTYSRPAVKGRKVYGDWPTEVKGEATLDNQNARPKDAPLVPWGHVWRAGANEGTIFATNDDVLINGQPLAAGRYMMAAIPAKEGDWTIVFNKEADQWGAFSYDEKYDGSKDILRVKTTPKWGSDSVEFLTYDFDTVTADSATVNLRWEKAIVPFTVKVPDVNTKALAHLRAVVAEAKPDDFATPNSAAGYARSVKATDDAAKFTEAALKAVDLRLKNKEDFTNLRAKAAMLFNLGRNQDAIVVGEKAVAAGKAEKADATQVAALEKRVTDAKAAAAKPTN